MTTSETAIYIDGLPISSKDLLDLIRKQGAIPRLVQEWVLDDVLKEITLTNQEELNLLEDYRNTNGLVSLEDLERHLEKRHINQSLLKTILSRPSKVIKYREERWGARAQSLYLANKDQYDTVTYKRLQISDYDVMQEIYFRLKDGEESWDSLARQFPGADPNATAVQGPISVKTLEQPILSALRKSKPGTVLRPIQLESQVAVISLICFEASNFDDILRTTLMRDAFDSWLLQESNKLIEKITFSL